MVDNLLSYMNPYVWLILGTALILIEVFLGSFFFLWIGLSALLVGGIFLVIPTLSGEIQVFTFAVVTSSALFLWRQYRLKHPQHWGKHDPKLNARAAQYMGKSYPVFEAIQNGRGKIKIGDSLWLVEGKDCPVGTLVEVTGVDGTILKTKPSHTHH